MLILTPLEQMYVVYVLINTNFYSILGVIAILFWSIGPVFLSELHDVPLGQILMLGFLVSWLFSFLKLACQKRWSLLKQPIHIWIFSFLGIFGNNIAFIAAIKSAPCDHVQVITFLWPLWVIFLSSFILGKKLLPKYILAAVLGLLGIWVLLFSGNETVLIELQYLPGYLLAFLAGIIWALYTITLQKYGKTPLELVGMSSGIGVILAAYYHFYFETHITLSLYHWTLLLLLGTACFGAAYYFWEIGVKKGQVYFITILSYGKPIFAVFWLVLFGKATLELNVILAALIVMMACLIATIDWSHLYLMKRFIKSCEPLLSFGN